MTPSTPTGQLTGQPTSKLADDQLDNLLNSQQDSQVFNLLDNPLDSQVVNQQVNLLANPLESQVVNLQTS